jgi:hypothetical protein
MPGEIEIEEWKCLAELIDNSFDDFNEIMISIILEAGRATMSILAVRQHRLRPGFNAFAISPLLWPRAPVGAAVVSRTAQPCFETASLPSCHIS